VTSAPDRAVGQPSAADANVGHRTPRARRDTLLGVVLTVLALGGLVSIAVGLNRQNGMTNTAADTSGVRCPIRAAQGYPLAVAQELLDTLVAARKLDSIACLARAVEHASKGDLEIADSYPFTPTVLSVNAQGLSSGAAHWFIVYRAAGQSYQISVEMHRGAPAPGPATMFKTLPNLNKALAIQAG
jgi:hypothetical protein